MSAPGSIQDDIQEGARDALDTAHQHAGAARVSPPVAKTFSRDTSLVLVGIRGSGLSSLAVIAAKALRFRILDVKSCFAVDHGTQRSEYAKVHGWKACRVALVGTLTRLLNDNPKTAILVCGPEVLDPAGQSLLRDFAVSHPVILISRDLPAIQDHLGLKGKIGADHVLQNSAQMCRQVSNLEFHNLPERDISHRPISDVLAPLRSPLAVIATSNLLQNLKRDFVEFLNRALPPPANKLSQVLHPTSPEFREFSNAMRLPLSDCLRDLEYLGTLECTSDAIELVVTMSSLKHEDRVHFHLLNKGFQTARRVFSLPVILHVEATEDELLADVEFYADLVRHGARLLPEFITVDLAIPNLDLSRLMSQLSSSKVIGHRNLRVQDVSPWDGAHGDFDRAVSLGCDVVRLIGHANSPLDDRRCFEFQAVVASSSTTPLIAVNVGIPAQASAIFNPNLTPVSPHNSTDANNCLMSSHMLMDAKFQNYIYQPLQFYIIGASVSYSLSPTLHNAGFQYTGMRHVYTAHETNSIQTIRSLVNDNYGGASISLPFKTDIIPFLDSVSEACEAIQAVNTILPIRTPPTYKSRHLTPKISKEHKNRAGPVISLHGENTDWVALHTCIARHLAPANEPTETSSALVIGAGGMARASVYALHRSGVANIVLWNRSPEKANSLAEHFNKLFCQTDREDQHGSNVEVAESKHHSMTIRVLPSLDSQWPADLAQPSIIICTIPSHKVGDAPPPNFTIPQQWFSSRTGGLVIEVYERSHIQPRTRQANIRSQLSYKTRWTPLLQQVAAKKDQGWNFVEPLEVLIEQGCAQFELFTGCPAPRNHITEKVVQRYRTYSS